MCPQTMSTSRVRLPAEHIDLCDACDWTIADRPALVRSIAMLCMGMAEHISRPLQAVFPNGGYEDYIAIAKSVIIPSVTDSARLIDAEQKRDGWLLELIAWLVTHEKHGENGYVCRPNPRPGHHGIDVFALIHIGDDGHDDMAVLLGECKVSQETRDVIRDEVWAAFRRYEDPKSGYLSEIAQRQGEALARMFPADEARRLQVERALLAQGCRPRKYMCAVAAKERNSWHQAHKLAEGYNQVVPGDVECRQLACLRIPDGEFVRTWFSNLAHSVNLALDEMGAGHV